MSEHPSPLPPQPRREYVIQALLLLATALFTLGIIGWAWGIESRWSWLPHSDIGMGIYLAVGLYASRKAWPIGPYAPWSIRQRLLAGLCAAAVFGAVIVPTVAAH